MPSGALVEADVKLRHLLENILVENRKQTEILAKLLSATAPNESIEDIFQKAGAGGDI